MPQSMFATLFKNIWWNGSTADSSPENTSLAIDKKSDKFHVKKPVYYHEALKIHQSIPSE